MLKKTLLSVFFSMLLVSCAGLELPDLTLESSTNNSASNNGSTQIFSSQVNNGNFYTVTYNARGGTSVSSQQVAEGSLLSYRLTSRVGYVFDGWYISYNFGQKLEDKWNFLTDKVYLDITLYANWVEQYTITFDSVGGTNVNSITAASGTPINAPRQPSRQGFTFNGWYYQANAYTIINYNPTENNSGSTLYLPFIFATMPAYNITLYAMWTPNFYMVNIFPNGAIFENSYTGFYFGAPIHNLPFLRRQGYFFIGWYEDVNLTIPLSHITMPDRDLNLYAKWEQGSQIIKFGGENAGTITNSGQVLMWGRNWAGQLGNDTSTDFMSPVNITARFNLSGTEYVESLQLGYSHTSALTSTGRVFMWGNNSLGQLGDGTNEYRFKPLEITSRFNLMGSEKIVSLQLGHDTSYALSSSGQLFSWGDNNSGQLGDGTTISKNNPVNMTSQFNLNTGETITMVRTKNSHTIASTSIGRVFAWGANGYGQLGNGNSDSKNIPMNISSSFNISNPETIIDIQLGFSHSSLLTSAGRLFMWGINYGGQIGNGGYGIQYTPITINNRFTFLTNESISSIRLGSGHSVALTNLGRVFAWGENYNGQLGNGEYSSYNLPQHITGRFTLLANETITSLSVGSTSNAAMTSTGRLFVWGSNNQGQLGIGNYEQQVNPWLM
jgi:uncharacterized repeat protein (TIGR02543 family)